MKSHSNIIGVYLRQKRQEAGLSLREVAEHAKVAESTVSRIESGHVLPTVDVLVKIGERLNIDLTELLAQLGARTKRELPEFEDYLREKYGVSEETINDMGVYFRLVANVS